MELNENREFKLGLVEKSSVSEEKREVTVVITEESLDLHGEVVISKGVNFKDFLTDGAIIFNHDSELILAKPLEIKRVGNRIILKMRFPQKGAIKRDRANPDDIWELIKLGAIQSLSIGFLNIEPPRMPSKLDIQNFGKGTKRILQKTKLIETSFVGIPSNRGTEILAMKSLNIDPKRFFGDDYVEEVEIEEVEIEEAPAIEIADKKADFDILVKNIKAQLIADESELISDKKEVDYKSAIKEELLKKELFKKGIIYI